MSDDTLLALGRGEVYFDRFLPGTREGEGELYIGNTTNFVVGREIDRLERYTAYRGQKIKTASAFVAETNTISFTTDNISAENISLWYGQDFDSVTYASSDLTEIFTIKAGRYYQLGRSAAEYGASYVRDVSVTRLGSIIPAAGNYQLDVESGRIRILLGGVLDDGDEIHVAFNRGASTDNVRTPAPKDQFGALRFVGQDGYGPLVNHFYPMVRLSTAGQRDLKGDEWQTMQFVADALKRDPRTEIVYVQYFSRLTPEVHFISDLGGISPDAFPYWENELDHLVNVTIPSRDYP